jgi:hypothetical protein
MGIIQIQPVNVGEVGVLPATVKMTTTDNLATITAAGYLNGANLMGISIGPTTILQVLYSYNIATNSGTYGEFTVSISSNVLTLLEFVSAGNVLLPVVANHIAIFNGTTGQVTGDLSPAINGGNIQAGLSGTAGTLASFPATAAKGSLIVAAVANTGNTTTTISNAAMGQASVISIPDPGAATANFLLNAGVQTMAAGSQIILAKVNGTEAANAVTASGMSGVITTSTLTTAGGASYAITWTNTFISATSVILLSIMGGTNTTENITLKATAGTGTSTLTIYNNTAATALNGTIFIGYAVL